MLDYYRRKYDIFRPWWPQITVWCWQY